MPFSFVTLKKEPKKLELLETPGGEDEKAGIEFKILTTSLSANNKFYLGFGEKAPFNFFQCYPVASNAKLVEKTGTTEPVDQDYVHPPVWGLCEVTKTNDAAKIPVGSVYRGMLPLGTRVSFETAHVEPVMDNVVIHRPTTNPAYNNFAPIAPDSVCHPSHASSGLALTCSPGIITGFGLFFSLQQAKWHDCDTIVLTSASSKVALALALYMKKDDNTTKNVIGITSPSNTTFCESTGLYDNILTYDDEIPHDDANNKMVMIDISGRGAYYQKHQDRIHKLWVVGGTADVQEKDSTVGAFSKYGTLKMILTFMGAPQFIRSRMNPSQELFLIVDIIPALLAEWGKEKYTKTVEEYTKLFCDEASKWIQERKCDTEESIETAFADIVQGKVPPSECIVLDVAKAVKDRNGSS